MKPAIQASFLDPILRAWDDLVDAVKALASLASRRHRRQCPHKARLIALDLQLRDIQSQLDNAIRSLSKIKEEAITQKGSEAT